MLNMRNLSISMDAAAPLNVIWPNRISFSPLLSSIEKDFYDYHG